MDEEKVTTVDDYNEIPCPHCKQIQPDMFESLSGLVTYWAEEGAQSMECVYCDKEFWLQEEVSRTWEVAKTEKDLNWLLD